MSYKNKIAEVDEEKYVFELPNKESAQRLEEN